MKRRTALGLIGAAAAAPYVMKTTSAKAEMLDLDPSNPNHTLMMYRKLAHTMDDSVTMWWAKLQRFGLVDTAFTPLWDVHVAAVLTASDVDDSGAYETTTISMVFYTDLETGAFMETFKNPYTGQEVEIGYFPAKPGTRVITKDGPKVEPQPRPGFSITTNHPLSASIEGEDVWVQSDDMTRLEPESAEAGRLLHVNDWNTYHGALKDVANTEIKNAPATWDFNDVLTWPAWLGMEDRPGNYVSRGFGRKVSSFADMPDDTRRLIEQHQPDIYKDPAGALKG